MKNLIVLILLLCVHVSYGQLVSWNLSGEKPTTGREISLPASVVKKGIIASELVKGGLIITKQGNARGFGGSLAHNIQNFEDAKKDNAFFEFSITLENGYSASLEAINYKLRVQEFSAKYFQWVYSIDNGITFIKINETSIFVDNYDNSGVFQPTLILSKIKPLQKLKSGSKVIFRLYTWGNDNSKDKFKISVGFGKSDKNNNNSVLELTGKLVKK